MKFKVLIAAILLSLALPVAADRAVIQRAYEVALSDVRLPQTEGGMITFKKCESCDFVTKRVTVGTQYQLNGKTTSLANFRTDISKITDRRDQPVTVLHNLESDQVTVVWVNL